eukprot:TRINITY_DN20489_c1_g4_i3.p1 TRINITY_DN20489_c1_g4~~TRINITY_DN20489_c1_g4_i3.p1  ORF type:complete len:402 (-),score=68.26 TRINITY_DN20489_c1_g4_i3:720-1925(-)
MVVESDGGNYRVGDDLASRTDKHLDDLGAFLEARLEGLRLESQELRKEGSSIIEEKMKDEDRFQDHVHSRFCGRALRRVMYADLAFEELFQGDSPPSPRSPESLPSPRIDETSKEPIDTIGQVLELAQQEEALDHTAEHVFNDFRALLSPHFRSLLKKPKAAPRDVLCVHRPPAEKPKHSRAWGAEFQTQHSEGYRHDGIFCDGLADGMGKRQYPNGDIYEGSFFKDLEHGAGKLVSADGGTYDGEWVFGEPAGEGIMTWANGNTYKGQFLHGCKHGRGTFRLGKDGDKYKGQFLGDTFHGMGQYNWQDGRKYYGLWQSGKMHGHGIMMMADETWYEGGWMENARSGEGLLQEKDGCSYKGQWINGRAEGLGTSLDGNGSERTGIWKAGCLITWDVDKYYL